MPDYSRGKIYKITSGDLTYIGSTTEPTLARRLAEHISAFKRWKAGTLKTNYRVFPLIETSQYEITLLELCPCNSKDELTARERFYIETNVCVNKNLAGRGQIESNKAYRAKNLEKIKAIDKAYKQLHAESEKKRKKEQREADIDRVKARDKAYYQANRDKILAREALKYQSRKNGQSPSETASLGYPSQEAETK